MSKYNHLFLLLCISFSYIVAMDKSAVSETENDRLLLEAARVGNHKEISKLLSLGASPFARTKDDLQNTPLILAVCAESLESIDALLPDPLTAPLQLAMGNRFGFTPINFAAEKDAKIIQKLVDRNADVNYCPNPINENNKIGQGLYQPPIMIALDVVGGATRTGECDDMFESTRAALEVLIKGGAHVNVQCDGRTPLLNAAQRLNFPIVKRLVEAGADIKARDAYKNTPFLLAARHNCECVLKRMVALGADIKDVDAEGNNALIAVVKKDGVLLDLNKIKTLLELGVDSAHKDAAEKTALEYIKTGRFINKDVAIELLEKAVDNSVTAD